jgi:DNA-binding response OmpR family regulator
MKTVLVVDDERQIAAIAGDYLRHAGFTVLTAGDGVEAAGARRLRAIPTSSSSTSACRDSMASTVARSLRQDGNVPIIMLTARVEESDRLARSWSSARTTTSASPSVRASWWRGARRSSPRRRERRHRCGLSPR